MMRSTQALQELIAQFQGLEKQRPTELDTVPPGMEGISYKLLDQVFESWTGNLSNISKSKWISQPDYEIADIAFAKEIKEINGLVAQGMSNGTHWMLVSSAFTEKVADVSLRVGSMADRRAGSARQLSKELAKSVLAEAGAISEAAPVAKKINALSNEATNSFRVLAATLASVNELLESANESAEEFQELRDKAEGTGTTVSERAAEAERMHAEMVVLRAKTDVGVSAFEARMVEIEGKHKEAAEQLESSIANLRKTDRDAKRQGLAGAFTARASRIQKERSVWLVTFIAAVVGLSSLAIKFALDITDFTYENLVVALLRRIALAAPMIWLGWYAARQVGRLNQIQEDYEYKAASALAFESYRNEIAASGDGALLNRLLDTTIKNFGDNPVRLYDDPDKEANTPAADLIKRLDDDGTISLLAKLRKIFGTGT